MSKSQDTTICILGAGNLGVAILSQLIAAENSQFTHVIATVRSEQSAEKLKVRFATNSERLTVTRDNLAAVKESAVVILGVDPVDVEHVLTQEGVADALEGKLLISVAAGWEREKIEGILEKELVASGSKGRVWVLRTLPNIAAAVAESITAIEEPSPDMPKQHLETADAIFQKIGKTVHLPARLMDAFTAVGGSTPAFFGVICEGFIDAAVAVGVPRGMATTMILQSMMGTATLLQNGMNPYALREQGTAPEGCTIGGLMVLEEGAIRGLVGRSLREAVTVARRMGKDPHVNDTRH